ncbi:MAG: alkaline phosphatase D family protein [Pseudomonadota bacterium]
MRKFSLAAAMILAVAPAAATAQQNVSHIAFGSCSHQDKDMPILDSIIADQPGVFLFLGDNVYGDTENMQELQAKYEKLGAKERFKQLRNQTQTLAIWDDHDYGANDAGKDYPKKEQSRQVMLDFWEVPEESKRRTRKDGIYTSEMYGEGEQKIHVIMPDLRWNRDDLKHVSRDEYANERAPNNLGPYIPHDDMSKSMLGEKQWEWLEQQLQKPSRVKVIASSLQLLADFTGWESWANFPADRQRLFSLIKKHKVNGVILVSGDTHWGEVSYYDEDLDYPLWEVTSSGLTQEWKDVSPNKHRIGQYTANVNYGSVKIDWEKDDPLVSLSLKDEAGDIVTKHSFRLSTLEPYKE